MADAPTTGELFKAKAILEEEVNAAVDAYLATPLMGAFPIAKGYRIDIAAAVAASGFVRDVLAKPDVLHEQKRKAVRTAILLARPEKG